MADLETFQTDHIPSFYSEEEFLHLLEKIHLERGWDFRNYKKSSIKRRVSLRLGANNILSYRDYHSVLDSDHAEYERLLSTLTIKVSEFFREPKVFDLLKELIVPSFFAEQGLRAWSCGCAYGEEAYSLGILLADSLGMDKLGNVKIFATDIDPKALDIARKGRYSDDPMRNVDHAVREAYFSKTGNWYRLKPEIRHLVWFGTLDIIRNIPISKIDVIFCRNLLIYFEKELQKQILEKLDFSLKPGGLLILGKSECLPSGSGLTERYVETEKESKVYRKIK